MKTLEECRKLFDIEDNAQIVIDSIWKRHWNNARNATDIIAINNLLKNHIRLFKELPERNNGYNRENIIKYLKNKLPKEAHQ